MQLTRRELLAAGCALPAACRSHAIPFRASYCKVINSDYFGIHCPRMGDNRFNGQLDYLSMFNAGSIRIWDAGLNWRQIEPAQGKFEWWHFDRFMKSAAAARLDVLYVLGQSPDWAAGPHQGRFGLNYNPLPPRSTDDWANYVAAVARRYCGKIRAYELWNEANLLDFYSGDPARLVQLATVARNVIRREDPAALLLGPSLTGSQGGRAGPAYLANLLNFGLGALVDGITVHLYVDPDSPDKIYDLMLQYRQVLKSARLDHLPIWNTEFTVHGFRQNSAFLEAPAHLLSTPVAIASVIEMMMIAWLTGCERSYWYGPDSPWSAIRFVSIESPRRLLPAGEAYRALASQVVGAKVLDYSRVDGTWLVAFSKGGGAFWLAWGERGSPAPLALRIAGGVRIVHPGPAGRFDSSEDATGTVLVRDPVFIYPRGAAVAVQRR